MRRHVVRVGRALPGRSKLAHQRDGGRPIRLADSRRFQADLKERESRNLPTVPIDERLLAGLEHGLPECAGVALGFDRLVMCAIGAKHIDDVTAFPFARA